MVTTQSADSVLKSYYLGAVSEQLNKAVNPLLAQIRQTTSDVWGKDVRKAVRIGVHGGVGAGAEDGALPKANGNTYAQFVTTLKNLYGTIEISDKAIRASRSNEGAFVDLLNDEMESLVKSSSFNFGRMLFGDGSGLLASFPPTDGMMTKFTVDTTANLFEGMTVDAYSKTGVYIDTKQIDWIDRENKVVKVLGTPFGTGDGGGFYVQGSKGMEITGLKAIFEAKKLYGVDRNEKNYWMKPQIFEDVGEITETNLQQAMDSVEEISGGRVNFIVCSWGVRRAIAQMLAAKRQIDTIELDGGYRAVSFNGVPVVADRFCPEGTAYLLNTDDFALHQLCDWQWLEGEDGKILKQIAGKPVYTATLVKYAELMCYRPCGQAMLKGITEQ